MSEETVVQAENRPKTLSGVWLDSLGFWFFLCMLEGFAIVVWVILEVLNHYYFATKPFSTFGAMIPW